MSHACSGGSGYGRWSLTSPGWHMRDGRLYPDRIDAEPLPGMREKRPKHLRKRPELLIGDVSGWNVEHTNEARPYDPTYRGACTGGTR